MRDGDFTLIDEKHPGTLSWIRTTRDGKAVIVALNFTEKEQTVSLDLAPYGIRRKEATVLLSSFAKAQQTTALSNMVLAAYGTFIGDVR